MHLRGCMFHLAYMLILVVFIYQVYVKGKEKEATVYQVGIIFGVIYPALYDTR